MGRIKQAAAARADKALRAYSDRHTSNDGTLVDLHTPLRAGIATALAHVADLGQPKHGDDTTDGE